MFEKEAEEAIMRKYPSSVQGYRSLIINWKEGAEFGYNKANEEMQEQGLALQSDMDKTIEQNIQLKKELNKANEWHYVKDGDLPPLNTNVLVIHRWARTPEVGKRIEVFINSSVWVWAMCSDRYRYTSDDENVIAWKEIVLPELKESE